MNPDDPVEPEPVPVPEPTVVVTDDLDAPTLPTEAYSETELREAVGASRRPSASRDRRPESLDEPTPPSKRPPTEPEQADEDPEQRSRRRRTMVVLAATLLVGLSIATLIFLGRANSARYEVVCLPDKIVAEQGRAFPPWGTRPMSGAEWKAIEIPPNAECQHHETEDDAELAAWYFDLLETRATVLLTGEATKIDLAEQQLNQALLLVRAPALKPKREVIERLLGDVVYWRASAKLRDAATALADAAKQFDAAAAQKPRIATDASAWASYIRKLADELHVGPKGLAQTFPPLPPIEHPDRPGAPPGVALPVEGSGSAKIEAPTPAPPPDAGVPSGGVLL